MSMEEIIEVGKKKAKNDNYYNMIESLRGTSANDGSMVDVDQIFYRLGLNIMEQEAM